jgi:glycosyltransferase involved in cell wall biosynthesis
LRLLWLPYYSLDVLVKSLLLLVSKLISSPEIECSQDITAAPSNDSKLTRIVFVITGLDTGGAEMMLLKLCRTMDRHRFDPVVVSLGDKGTVGPLLEAQGVTVYTLGMRAGRPSLGALLILRRLIKDLAPNVIQGWMYHGNLAASLAGRGYSVVWGIRQSLYDIGKERLLTRIVIKIGAILSNSSDAIIYNSQTSQEQHARLGYSEIRSRCISNGFDVDVFKPDSSARIRLFQELGLPKTAVVVGLIGRFHPQKDHRSFLRAASIVNSSFPDVHFVMVGNGVTADNVISTLIVSEDLRCRIHFLGERSDISSLNATFDVACSSSAWGEGFGNTIGEAMSCGVPCVVTDVGDSARIVGDTGLVVQPGSPSDLAEALKKLIALGTGGRKTLGISARQRVIENFSLLKIVNEYQQFYDRFNLNKGVS